MPKKTVELIVDNGHHYVLQVKANQKRLFRDIQDAIVEQPALSHFEEKEKNHGRHTHWTVEVFNAVQHPKTVEWKNLSRFIHVHRHCIDTKTGKQSHNDRLYISDAPQTDAQFFHQGIRGHWKIENSLHWVKDVIHGEDANGIKTKNGPVNSAIFSSIAINIHRKNGNKSIDDGQIKFRANVNELFDLFRT